MFNHKSTLIYANINNHLVSFSYNTELAYIRAALLDKSIPTTQFIDEKPSDIDTIIDDITFYSSEYIIFYIDTYLNLKLSYIISQKMQRQDFFDKEIIFLFKDPMLKLETNFQGFKHFTLEQLSLLSSYLGGNGSEMKTDLSIYQNNIVPLTYLPKIGISSRSKEMEGLKQDVSFLMEQAGSIDEVIPITLENGNINELLIQIKKLDAKYHFILPINLVNSIPLYENSIREFTILLNNEIKEFDLSIFYKKTIKVNFVIPCNSEDSLISILTEIKIAIDNGLTLGKIHFKALKRLRVSEEFLSLLNSLRKETNFEESSNVLFNGVLMFYTGVYTESVTDGAVKHVYIEGRTNRARLSELSKLISINSAILSLNNLDNQREYRLYDEELTVEDNNYSIFQKEAFSSLLFSHYHQWDGEVIQLDNNEIKELTMSSYGTNNKASMIDLKTPMDFQLFIDDVNHFVTTGSFKSNYQINSKLVNSCRWLGPSNCHVTKLPRLTVDEDGSLSPCVGCKKSIGTLDNELFELKENVQMITEEEKLNRGCETCEVRDYCSKCTFLPKYMSSDQYCYTRKNQVSLEEYITSSQILNFILNNSNYLKDNPVNLEDIKFSNMWTTHIFKKERKGKSNPLVNNNIYLIHMNGETIIFNLEKYNIIKIGTTLAYILEAFYKGYLEEDIPDFLHKDFNANLDEAIDFYNKSIGLFFKAGILKKTQDVSI